MWPTSWLVDAHWVLVPCLICIFFFIHMFKADNYELSATVVRRKILNCSGQCFLQVVFSTMKFTMSSNCNLDNCPGCNLTPGRAF